MKFERSYNTTPSVILTTNHNSTAPGNSAPVGNGIATWIEVIKDKIGSWDVSRSSPRKISIPVIGFLR